MAERFIGRTPDIILSEERLTDKLVVQVMVTLLHPESLDSIKQIIREELKELHADT